MSLEKVLKNLKENKAKIISFHYETEAIDISDPLWQKYLMMVPEHKSIKLSNGLFLHTYNVVEKNHEEIELNDGEENQRDQLLIGVIGDSKRALMDYNYSREANMATSVAEIKDPRSNDKLFKISKNDYNN